MGPFSIPPEVDQVYRQAADNLEVQLVVDIIEGLEDYDPIWDVPFDAWREKLVGAAADVPIPFAECDD